MPMKNKPYYDYIESIYQDALVDYRTNLDDEIILLWKHSRYYKKQIELNKKSDADNINVLAFHRKYSNIWDNMSNNTRKEDNFAPLMWFELMQVTRLVTRQAKENAMILKQYGF